MMDRLGVDGDVCTVAGECASGNCVDGVCCDEPCDGACSACTGGKHHFQTGQTSAELVA